MILFFLLMSTLFDQQKIDSSLEKLRQYSSRVIPASASTLKEPRLFSGRQLLNQEPLIEIGRDDIVVGDTPAETLIITGYFYNNGNIYVINDGLLLIQNADFNLDGNIAVVNHARAFADSSALNFIQHYIYHRGVTVADSAEFEITDCQTTFSGYPIGFWIGHWAQIRFEHVTNRDWITAVVSQQATAILDHVSTPGEWLFEGRIFASFKNVNNFLSWYFFPDSSVVSIKFPDGDTVNGFYLDSTLSNVDGVGYHVEIDSSTNCMWAAIPLAGSDVTIDSSLLRVTGLMFGHADTFSLSGLVNGLHYDDYVLPVSDRNYHLVNTTVQTWNLYPSDTANVTVSSSIFGELCAYANSYVTIMNAYCDGSGGHLEAANSAFLLVGFSSVFADIITKNRGMCVVGYCAMPMGNIWTTGGSLMIIINTQFPEDPVPSDTSIVFVAAVTAPSSAMVDDTVAIMGSAWIDRGPFQPVDFGFYRMSYRLIGDSAWISFGDSDLVEVRRDILEYWSTFGLALGSYEVRLVLKDNLGDSVECSKVIRLNPHAVAEGRESVQSEGLQVNWLGPRFFAIECAAGADGFAIYDAAGRRIFAGAHGKNLWLAPSAGVFFIRDTNGETVKKVIAF